MSITPLKPISYAEVIAALPHLSQPELEVVREFVLELAPVKKRTKSRQAAKSLSDLRMGRVKTAVKIWEQYMK